MKWFIVAFCMALMGASTLSASTVVTHDRDVGVSQTHVSMEEDEAKPVCKVCEKAKTDGGWCDVCKAGYIKKGDDVTKTTCKACFESKEGKCETCKKAEEAKPACDVCEKAKTDGGWCDVCKAGYIKKGDDVTKTTCKACFESKEGKCETCKAKK